MWQGCGRSRLQADLAEAGGTKICVSFFVCVSRRGRRVFHSMRMPDTPHGFHCQRLPYINGLGSIRSRSCFVGKYWFEVVGLFNNGRIALKLYRLSKPP